MSKINMKNRLAAALPFAHLLGLGVASASDDDSDDDMAQREGESDDEYAKRMEDEERKQRDGESDQDYAKRMEELDGDPDDDDDGEKEKATRTAERARCAAIFGAAAAGSRPDVAAHLAFNTDMASADAIKMLNTVASGGAPTARSLSSRMSSVQTPNPGASSTPSPAGGGAAASVAAKIVAA